MTTRDEQWLEIVTVCDLLTGLCAEGQRIAKVRGGMVITVPEMLLFSKAPSRHTDSPGLTSASKQVCVSSTAGFRTWHEIS
jgi:hypothetical protein